MHKQRITHPLLHSHTLHTQQPEAHDLSVSL
jgi:hypothetical protein